MSREECDAFCRKPENGPICLQFAVDEGKITQEEANYLMERMRMHEMGHMRPEGPPPGEDYQGGPKIDESKAMELMESDDFVGPGGCTTMAECDAYCSNSVNDEECFNYAVEHGLISQEEAEKFKRMLEHGGPGGCQGPAECDLFCSKEENQEVCLQFAIEHNLMPPEEIEHVRKMMDIMNFIYQMEQ